MSYIVTTSFYEGNTLHEQGTVFEHQDKAYIEKCLADGNIAVEGAEAQASAPDGFPIKEEAQEADQSTPPLEEGPVEEVEQPEQPELNQTEVQIQKDLENLEGNSEAPSSVNIQ